MIVRMGEFVPECTIHVALAAQGKPAKRGWAVMLVDKEGRALVSAVKFRGIADAHEVSLEALLWGMEQALRIKCEKVHLFSRVDTGWLGDRVVKSRDPETRVWENKIKEAWACFRLSKVVTGDFAPVMELARKAANGVRDWEDMDV